MPPLPTTFDDATKASITSIQRRQNDLREFQIPRLRGCSDSLSVQQQYAAELREDLESITHLVEVSTHAFLSLFVLKEVVVGLRRDYRNSTQRAKSEGPPRYSRKLQSGLDPVSKARSSIAGV
jgi:hypothetical protein